MTTSTVTKPQIDTTIVTIVVLLDRVRAALASWQWDAQQAADKMAELREAGVFLDQDQDPVLPTWWIRSDRPSRWLIWPADYARQAGIPRRQRVDAGGYEATEAKRQRTIEYANHKARYDRLMAQIEGAAQDLTRLAAKYGW